MTISMSQVLHPHRTYRLPGHCRHSAAAAMMPSLPCLMQILHRYFQPTSAVVAMTRVIQSPSTPPVTSTSPVVQTPLITQLPPVPSRPAHRVGRINSSPRSKGRTFTGNTDSGAVWNTPLNWTNVATSLTGLPGASDDVIISRIGATPTITILSGTNAVINTLFSDETVTLSGGDLTLTSASRLTGDLSITSLNSAITNNALLTIDGDFNWANGGLFGAGDITINGILTMSGDTTRNRRMASAKTVTHTNGSGSSLMSASADINIKEDSTFVNAAGAILNIDSSGGTIEILAADSGAGTFDNQGTLNKLGVPNDITTLNFLGGTGLSFVNSGTLNIQQGSIEFASTGGANVNTGTIDLSASTFLNMNAGAGTFDLTAGDVTGTGTSNLQTGTTTISGTSAYSLTGTTVIGSTLNLDTALTLAGTVNLSGGTLNANALTTMGGAFNWATGTLAGSGSLITNGTTTVTSSPNNFDILNWTNNGTLNIDNILTFGAGVTLTNGIAGTINYNSTNGSAFGSGGTGITINNNGILNKAIGSAATVTLNGTNFTLNNSSTGTINVDAGIFNATNGSFLNNSGIVDIDSGATLDANGKFTNNSSATIQGSGTLDTSGNTLTNSGTISPGSSIGTLIIDGDLILDSNSILDIEIAGTGTAGINYDLITVNGDVTLAGTINVIEDSFTINVGNQFDFMTYSSVTAGSITSINSDFGDIFTATDLGTALRLEMISDTAIFWDGDVDVLGDGINWSDPFNWSLDAVPTMPKLSQSRDSSTLPSAFDDVLINVGSLTVTASSGAQFARQLSMPTATDNLSITAGSLTLDGVSSIAGNLTISGSGQVNFNDDVSLSTLTMFANSSSIGEDPTLDGSGDITITSNFGISLTGNVGSDNIDVFIQGTGKLITAATTTTTITSDGTADGRVELSRDWDNFGTVIFDVSDATADFVINGGTIFTNKSTTGIFNFASTLVAGADVFGAGTFENEGTVNQQDGDAHGIFSTFNNTGTLNVNAGTFNLATGTSNR